jgi:DNA (cytosine-5)-methyltransferase 1
MRDKLSGGISVADIKIFSFFSGLGLLDLGFQNAGFNVALANEVNKSFMDAYKFSRDNLHISDPQYGYANCDIKDILNDKKWNDIITSAKKNAIIGFIGGPPCPDFSFAGKNEGYTGTNGILTQIYVDLIINKQPDFFMLENVKGLVQTKKHNEFFQNIKTKLIASGYYLVESIENALLYGVPQYRDRLFLFGFNTRTFGMQPNFALDTKNERYLNNILDLPWPNCDKFGVDTIRECPLGIRHELTVQHWFDKNDVDNHLNAKEFFVPKLTTEKFYLIEEGNTHGKSFKRLHRWRFSPTAAYGNNEVHLHPFQPRRISVAEAMAIQSLPKDFVLPTNLPLSVKFKMIGNGVPYLMSLKLATILYTWLQQNLN